MIKVLATRTLRSCSALLLIPCLLAMGVVVSSAPPPEEGKDGMSAPVHAVRGPVLRPLALTGHAPDAAPALGFSLPADRVVRESGEHRTPVLALRSAERPTHHSRAPPASA